MLQTELLLVDAALSEVIYRAWRLCLLKQSLPLGSSAEVPPISCSFWSLPAPFLLFSFALTKPTVTSG
jgi:hypothetical protein